MNITIDPILEGTGIPARLGLITGRISVHLDNKRVKEAVAEFLRRQDGFPEPKSFPSISGGRKFYRAVGKDPARYRLSSESLMRRIRKGMGLYEVNDLVDLMNLFSLMTGHPVGLYDTDKIHGEVTWGVGTASDNYEGLGRGVLNIADMPALIDETGPFGTATSDSPRTAISEETARFAMVIYAFGDEDLLASMETATQMLREYLDCELDKGVIIGQTA